MKFNIFARLNKLEKDSDDKQLQLEAMQNSIEKLSDLVVFQGKVIGHLNKYAKFYPEPVVNAPPVEAPKVEQPAPVVESKKERIQRKKREWYEKNREIIIKRRKREAQRKQAAKHQRTYYWRNLEKMREYGRQRYLKKKAEKLAAKE
jgi:hypothetical protein